MAGEQPLDFILVSKGKLQAGFQVVSLIKLLWVEIMASIIERLVNRSHQRLTEIDRMSASVALLLCLIAFRVL